MPIPIQVYQQAKKFEQEGYSASEILQGLEQSKYADISTQIKQFREEGYSDDMIYQGFNKSPVAPISAINLARETLSTPLQNVKEFYSPMVDKVRDINSPESVKNVANRIWKAPQEMTETGAGVVTGALSYIPAKTAGSIVGAFDTEKGKKVEEAISNMFSYKPQNEYARQNMEGIGQVLDYILKPAQKGGEIVSSEIKRMMPADISGTSKNTADWLGYITQFGLELAEFKGIGIVGKEIKKGFTPKEKTNIIIDKIRKGEPPPISTIKETPLPPEELKAKIKPPPEMEQPLKESDYTPAFREPKSKEIPVYETTPREIAGERIIGKAHPAPDGTPIYITENGRLLTADGREVQALKKISEPQAGEGEYRGKHQIKEGQTTADNLLKIVPEDYLTNANVYSDLTDISTKESYRVLKNIQGKPDAIVTIYRAVPKGVDKINKGDWITLSKKYAIDHGKDMKDPSADMPVISMKVKTKDIAWDGNDINEFSYKGLPEKVSPAIKNVEQGKVESVRIEKNIIKLTPSQRNSLELAYRQIEESTVGRRIVSPEEGSGTYEGTQIAYDYINSLEPSTFPKWNRGMGKEVSLPLIRKALDGKPVTPAQKFRIENILDGIRGEELEQLRIMRSKPSEKPVADTAIEDTFKRDGEGYTVKDIDPDTGKTTFKNKDTFQLDQTDTIKYDRGTYKPAPIEEAPFGAEYGNLSLEDRAGLLERQGRPDLADKLRQEEMFKVERNFPQDKLQGKGKQKEGFEMTEEIKARENEVRQIKLPDEEADVNIPAQKLADDINGIMESFGKYENKENIFPILKTIKDNLISPIDKYSIENFEGKLFKELEPLSQKVLLKDLPDEFKGTEPVISLKDLREVKNEVTTLLSNAKDERLISKYTQLLKSIDDAIRGEKGSTSLDTPKEVKVEKLYTGIPMEDFIGKLGEKEKPVFRGVDEGTKTAIEQTLDVREQRLNMLLRDTVGKILPSSQTMKHPIFRQIYEHAKDFTTDMEITRFKLIDKELTPLLKKTPKDIKENIFRFMEMDIEKVPEQYKSYVKEYRTFLDKVRDYAVQNDKDVGYVKDYMPHMFDGNWWVIVDGEHAKPFKTIDMAIDKAVSMANQGKKIKAIQPKLPPDIYDLFIADKRLKRLVFKLQDDFTLEFPEIKKMLAEAGIKKIPRQRFFSNFLQRKTENPYYIQNFEDVINMYSWGTLRKVNQDKFLKNIQPLIESADPSVRHTLEAYKSTVLGHPAEFEKALTKAVNLLTGQDLSPMNLRKATWRASALQYVSDLGFMVSSAGVNLTQLAVNTFPLVGSRTMRKASGQAFISLKNKKSSFYRELVDKGIIEETATGLEMRIWDKPLAVPLKMFTGIEQMNRSITYFAGKDLALRNPVKAVKILQLLDVPKSASIYNLKGQKFVEAFASELVDNTQFRSEPFNIPPILKSPEAKLFLPYKTFLINQHLFMYKLLKHSIKNPLTYGKYLATFLGVSFLLGGEKTNIFTQTTYNVMDEAFKKEFGMSIEDADIFDIPIGEIMKRGIPAQLGLDISGALALQNPYTYVKKPLELTGRYGKALYHLVTGESEETLRDITPRIVQTGQKIYTGVTEGKYESKKGTKIIDIPDSEFYKIALGFTPKGALDVYKTQEEIRDIKKWYKDEVLEQINNYASAMDKKDTKGMKESWTKLVTLRNGIKEQLNKASGIYKMQLTVKRNILGRAMNNPVLLINALKREKLGAVEREKDIILRDYAKKRTKGMAVNP